MAYQALYRKWRPQAFSQVLGQTAAVKALQNQIATGRIGHAYLFCGCRGTGKTTMAKLMSRAINCLEPVNGEPCGTCNVCQAIQNETNMDVLEFDAASKSRVEDMRDLLEPVRYPPQMGRYKVYIIDEVHMLSAAAFNALLKTLEEPPEHVVFILATTEPQKIPATILSRVQRYDFGRIPMHLMISRMTEALNEMGFTAENEALQIIARSAEGAMRDAFSILDMCIAGATGNLITTDQTREMLGVCDADFLFDFADCLANKDYSGLMLKIDELIRAGREPQTFLKDLAAHVRSLLTVSYIQSSVKSILDITDEEEQHLRKQASLFTQERLLRILDLCITGESEMRFASSPRIGLESCMIHACDGPSAADVSGLNEKIHDLEKQLTDLKDELTSGTIAIHTISQAKPVKAQTAEKSAPVEKKREPLSGETEIWNAALKMIQKGHPMLYNSLRMKQFLGESNGKFRVLVPADKIADIRLLNKEQYKVEIEKALSEVAGKPLFFEAETKENTSVQTQRSFNAEAILSEAFERENVQIIDEPKA